ncbi:MAG: DNA recombination protein RmuC [Desulfomicrobium sp.]|nr:DNA recombination protein RmuC [Desulfomicrobium sp.]
MTTEILIWIILAVAMVTTVVTIFFFILLRAEYLRIHQEIRIQLRDGREESREAGRSLREEVALGLKASSQTLSKNLVLIARSHQKLLEKMVVQLQDFSTAHQASLEQIRTTLDVRVKELQASNEQKLEQMRQVVDEQLHATLERRLGESFQLVSQRLEAVHQGLGEMQNLATGVGDLKRVLNNVKARGTWAEIQLEALLDQVLTSKQYEKNVCVRPGSLQRVEFAVRLPGPKDQPHGQVWLPIDSKFPQEDYLRLQDAAEKADMQAVQTASNALARTIREAARDIHEKYINPPETTDFAIMFLATEGLYAEILRQSALIEELQQKYRIIVAGPTTLVAILNSLRLGFQTLAIEERASEVWRTLRAVKTEFQKFGDTLDKVKQQLHTASRTIEQTGVRSRALERKLKNVEQLPETESATEIIFTDEKAKESHEKRGFSLPTETPNL